MEDKTVIDLAPYAPVGGATVRNVYHVWKNVTVAGCFVREGIIRSGDFFVVRRAGKVIHENRSRCELRRFKDAVDEVHTNFEFGLVLAGYSEYEIGDQIETYQDKQTGGYFFAGHDADEAARLFNDALSKLKRSENEN